MDLVLIAYVICCGVVFIVACVRIIGLWPGVKGILYPEPELTRLRAFDDADIDEFEVGADD